jgi:ABC-2 type transport system ATP-binding protein
MTLSTLCADCAIALTDLHHQFDGKPALAGISAQIRRGTITGIVGPDGSGKTTLVPSSATCRRNSDCMKI